MSRASAVAGQTVINLGGLSVRSASVCCAPAGGGDVLRGSTGWLRVAGCGQRRDGDARVVHELRGKRFARPAGSGGRRAEPARLQVPVQRRASRRSRSSSTSRAIRAAASTITTHLRASSSRTGSRRAPPRRLRARARLHRTASTATRAPAGSWTSGTSRRERLTRCRCTASTFRPRQSRASRRSHRPRCSSS